MKGSLGFHLTNTLELRKESERGSVFKYRAIRSCLEDLINQLHDFEKESCLLLKLADTGRVALAVQHCLETTLTILKLQESEENILWRNAFQRERDEWMARIKLLLASGWKMKLEIGGKRQALEILTRLRYGGERYGDVMTPEEMDVTSDVFDTVVHSSNAVVVENPGWFATSTHDWSSSKTSPVPGTDGQIYRDVNLWADLHHPHVRKFLGACHVGKEAFVIHDRSFRIYEFGVRWKELLGCAHGLEFVHGCGLVHLNLTLNDLLLSLGNVGVLSGLGLVRRSEVSKTSHLLKEQQPSPERDILTFGLIIFYLLSERRNRSYRRLATNTPRPIQLPKQLPVNRPQSIEEEEWELLSLMCSPNSVNRIGIRDVIYRMELLADHENLKKSKNDTGKMEVVEDLRLFMVSTLGLTLEETLSEIELLCNDLPEFSAVNQSVLSRLKDVYFQLHTAVDPLSLDIVEKFSLILLRFLDSLDRRGFGAGSLVASVCASRTIANKNYSIHHNLDRLIQSTSQLQSGSSIHAWRPHFQEMQDLQRSTLQTFWENPRSTLDKLSEVDQREAAALLEFEARNHSDEFAAPGASHLSSSLPKWFIPSYQVKLGRHIADGSFGSVYEGKWLDTDVVVKLVTTDQRTAENRRQFLREVDLWFSLSDEYLVKLYGACHLGLPFFVCERAVGGTLGEYLQGRSMRKRWSCIYQAAKGLQHLHDHGIIHGDLKGNNIVMGAFSVMLCDFGLASLASSSPKQLDDTEINTLGAVQWKAPECLLGSAPTFASDIYSFGMCIIEIITGQYPWGTAMLDSVVKLKVMKEKRLPPRAEGIGDDAWSLIMHMCCFDPGQRVTIGTVASMAYEVWIRM